MHCCHATEIASLCCSQRLSCRFIYFSHPESRLATMDWLFPGLTAAPNAHPVFVHFPIAFWLGAFLFCCMGLLRPNTAFYQVGCWLLHIGTVAAVIAVTSGFVATARMDHDAPGHDLVHDHRNVMIAASIMSLIASTAFVGLRHRLAPSTRMIQVALLGAVVAVSALGADRGALLVYGYGVGTRRDSPPPAASDHEHAHDSDPSHAHEHK